jgi:hypothetical protein
MTLVKELERSEQGQERRLRMSYEQFLNEVDEDIHAEWVDGEAIIYVKWLWQAELPNPLSALAQIVGPDTLIEFLQQMKTDDE